MKPARLAVLLLLSIPAQAGDTWRGSRDAAIHATAEATGLQSGSVLNPANLYARLAEQAHGIEARINLKLETDVLRLTLRPILSLQRRDDGFSTTTASLGTMSQWQLRAPLSESVSLSLGREVMNWGPAQFRSPSSPFYFDNGRSNPSRELSGVDAIKLAWTPDANLAASLAWIQDNGAMQASAGNTKVWDNTWLAKGELRGDDWTGGLVWARASGRAPFLGAYAQWTPDAAWLVYGEAASLTRADALRSPADPTQPFSLQSESARHGIALIGATRTLENGQGLSLEYLRNGQGYSQAEADACFTRAAGNPISAIQVLSHAPPLLGRNYLHLVWQSNMLADDNYWRLMWSRNLDDASQEWAAYYDHPVNRHLSLYALGEINTGGPRREFSALIEHSLNLGLRLALP